MYHFRNLLIFLVYIQTSTETTISLVEISTTISLAIITYNMPEQITFQNEENMTNHRTGTFTSPYPH